jgi:hypothetical protein
MGRMNGFSLFVCTGMMLKESVMLGSFELDGLQMMSMYVDIIEAISTYKMRHFFVFPTKIQM